MIRVGSAVEVYPLEAPDHAVLNPDREFSDIERARMVNDIISRFGAIASDNQVAGLWNSIREDKVKPSDVRDGHRAFWVENLIENLLSLKRTITTLNPNTSFSVERELYRYFNKAASTFKIGGTERRGLRLWGRNIPFNRAIRYLSNRNKVYADNEVVSSWYVGGKSHKAKAFEIARMFDLM